MTQKEAILTILKEGKTLNILTAFKQTGTMKLSTRCSEFAKQGYVFKKEKINFTTRYKTKGYYFNYTLNLKKTLECKATLEEIAQTLIDKSKNQNK